MATGTVPEITVTELKEALDRGEKLRLIDVREPHERDIASIGGDLIPLGTLEDRIDELDEMKNEPVVVYCRSGARSGRAVAFLQEEGFRDIRNLKGGILAWSREIDPSIPQY
jgi:sulfur-carrier protein adenylyltransferase/sulfurtransferase